MPRIVFFRFVVFVHSGFQGEAIRSSASGSRSSFVYLLCHGSAEAIFVPSFLSEGVGHFRLATGVSPTVPCK